ncbi:hypothetical protein [Shewanella waksmanii]|uniref:hypothetical protein n=1 Tax=Shewanella waksmanii TaxID=213783 RepID=UPI0004909B4F|nr:hypothetical protein [Shewanella waksmanii]
MKYKQSGIALLQALLITLVIIVMAIGFSYNARDQVEIAADFVARTEADLKLDSAKSDIMYWLSVKEVHKIRPSGVPKGWNLYGKPFTLEKGITVSIQDIAGLYPINLLGEASDRRWLTAIGIPDSQATTIAAGLASIKNQSSSRVGWASNDSVKRNMQFLEHEFRVAGVPEQFIGRMSDTATIYPTTYLNPLNMPDNLLPLLYPRDAVTAVVDARNQGQLTQSMLRQLTGISNYDRFFMNIQMHPVGLYRVEVQSEVNDIKVNRLLELMLLPRTKPYIYVLQERNV